MLSIILQTGWDTGTYVPGSVEASMVAVLVILGLILAAAKLLDREK